MLTAAGTLLLIFNLDLIVGGIRSAVGGIGRLAPVIRTAAAYPAAARYRTGMTIAMIALNHLRAGQLQHDQRVVQQGVHW